LSDRESAADAKSTAPPAPRATDWQATWDAADAVRTVPGTHFTIAEQDAPTTAQAIDEWLARLSRAATGRRDA
jgi:surfactin synthase thioesterase subunit